MADDFQTRLSNLEDEWRDRLANCTPEKRGETRDAYWAAKLLLERQYVDTPVSLPHGWEGEPLKEPIVELQDFLHWLNDRRRYVETLTASVGLRSGFPEGAAIEDAGVIERDGYRLLELLGAKHYPRPSANPATLDEANRRLGRLRDWAFNLLAEDVAKSNVPNPLDLSNYRSATVIRTKHTPEGIVLDHNRLLKFLESHPSIRRERPPGKNGKPRSNRLMVHLVDWVEHHDALKEWDGADVELNEVAERTAAVRKTKQSRK